MNHDNIVLFSYLARFSCAKKGRFLLNRGSFPSWWFKFSIRAGFSVVSEVSISTFIESNTDFFQNQAHDLSVAESSEKGDKNQGFPNKPILTLESVIPDKFSNFFFGKNVGLLFHIYMDCFDDRLQSWILLERFTIIDKDRSRIRRHFSS